MKGICKKTDSLGVVTHVLVVQSEHNNPFTITVEEYVDQGYSPDVSILPVCKKPDASDA